MAPIDEPASFEPKPRAAEGRKPKTSAPASGRPADTTLVAFTVDAGTGRVVKIEGVDAAGARHELSEDERARLSKKEARATLEGIVEQAFEAGIGCLLGAEGGETETPESEEDADLRRVLLRSLIGHSAAKSLMRRDVLSRAIVGTLIDQAASYREPKSKSSAAH